MPVVTPCMATMKNNCTYAVTKNRFFRLTNNPTSI